MNDNEFIKEYGYREYLSISEELRVNLGILKANKKIKYYRISLKKKKVELIVQDKIIEWGIIKTYNKLNYLMQN